MLTLSRKESESIIIFTGADEQIEITIERIAGGQVKLSFEAPGTVDIWREELLELESEEHVWLEGQTIIEEPTKLRATIPSQLSTSLKKTAT